MTVPRKNRLKELLEKERKVRENAKKIAEDIKKNRNKTGNKKG
jgi:hypothetical protein